MSKQEVEKIEFVKTKKESTKYYLTLEFFSGIGLDGYMYLGWIYKLSSTYPNKHIPYVVISSIYGVAFAH